MNIKPLKTLKVEPIVLVDHKHSNQENAMTVSTNRFNQMDKFVRESLAQDRAYFEKESGTLQDVLTVLKAQSEQLDARLKHNQEQKQALDEEFQESNKELAELKQYIPPTSEEQIQKEILELKQKILLLNKNRQDESGQLVISEFNNINIKNKDKESPINDIWIWVLQVIYKEAASSYSWHNFREQVFNGANDKGEDFKYRLGRIKAVDMKKDEIDKTASIIKAKDKIIGCELVTNSLKPQLERLFKIVELIMQTESIGIQVHEHENNLKKLISEKAKVAVDVERVDSRIKILSERKAFLEVIQVEYKYMSDALKVKIQSYIQAQQLNQQFIQQLDAQFKNIDYSKSYDETFVPPPVATIQHQSIHPAPEAVLDNYQHHQHEEQQQQQHYQQQEVQQEEKQIEQFKQEPIEVQATPNENHNNNEIQQTDITQNKTGGCEACAIF